MFINDIDLLNYLHLNKVASTFQVQRDLFSTYRRTSVLRRLKNLQDLKFVKSNIRPATNTSKENVYSLTLKGLEKLNKHSNTTIIGKKLKSDCLEHDLELVDIRSSFLKSKKVISYYSENQLQSYLEVEDDNILRKLKNYNFDALMICKTKSGAKGLIAIENERTDKSELQYKEKISRIYDELDLSLVLYFCHTRKIERKIKNIESKIYTGSTNKIAYYSSLNLDTLTNDLVFYTQKNKIINFYN